VNLAEITKLLDMEKFKTFMRQFVTFTDEEWQSAYDFFKKETIAKGKVILKQGTVCQNLSFIEAGAFRQYRTEDVDEYAYDFSFEEDYAVDFKSFLTGSPATINISALRDSVVVSISKSDLDKVYQICPAFQEFGRLMVERAFVYDDERIQSLLYDTPEERYLKLMQRDAHLLAEIPLYSIASYMGVRPETLSRIRANLSKKK
jgi:CRP/FNR family transcriptional regulator, anaerobic regulatory protein